MCLNLRWEELTADFCATSVSTGWQSQFCCHQGEWTQPFPSLGTEVPSSSSHVRAVQVHRRSHTLDYFLHKSKPSASSRTCWHCPQFLYKSKHQAEKISSAHCQAQKNTFWHNTVQAHSIIFPSHRGKKPTVGILVPVRGVMADHTSKKCLIFSCLVSVVSCTSSPRLVSSFTKSIRFCYLLLTGWTVKPEHSEGGALPHLNW